MNPLSPIPPPPPAPIPPRVMWRRLVTMGLLLGLTSAGLVLLETSCATPQTRDEWLRFFFDGVPPRGGVATNAPVAAPPATVAVEEAALRGAPSAAPHFIHDPFAEHDCQACHQTDQSQRMRGTVMEVCYTCHEDFAAPPAKVVHDPVSGGECLACHNPHESDFPTLLIKPLPGLCYECHDDMTRDPVKHPPAAKGECLQCHNPHASKNKALLVRAGAELCFKCHQDTVSKAAFKHAPAEEGECLECHNPHAAKEPNLLVAKQPALCFACHDEKDIARDEAHLSMGEKSCTDCHNPHQGDKEFFLK